MRHYSARQLKDSGLWHYTVQMGGRAFPTGYCAKDCPGHDTADAARGHYKAHLLDGAIETTLSQWSGCRVCDQPTKKAMLYGSMGLEPLCEAHCNRESLEPLVKVGESWES